MVLAASAEAAKEEEAITERRVWMAGKFQPYRGEKRRKETARKAKKEEKLRKKLEKKEGALPTEEGEPEGGSPLAEEPPPGPAS
jgi:hypothetical protein